MATSQRDPSEQRGSQCSNLLLTFKEHVNKTLSFYKWKKTKLEVFKQDGMADSPFQQFYSRHSQRKLSRLLNMKVVVLFHGLLGTLI